MYKHLLIATDGSASAQKAVDQGLRLAAALDAKVTVVTVTEPWDAFGAAEGITFLPPEGYMESIAAEAAKVLAGIKHTAETLGRSCDTMHVKDRFSADGIIECASEKGCDLIVMGSHGRRGLRRLLLGSVANEVVTHSTVPVLICR
jgi:nucleotide-binding universal stress UspA family protein